MKKLLLVLLFFISFLNSRAQVFGNEWIVFDQTYFKFKIITDGFYRLDYSTLQQFGVPVNSIFGSNIQIFNKGKEIPIYVTTTGILGTNDYIEFYAVHNDGWWDSTLYADHTWQGNDRMSMFNDTAYYFLTWSSQPSTMHMVDYPNTITNPPPKEQYCFYTSSYVYGNPKISSLQLSRGKTALAGQYIYNSDFSPSEGYSDYYFNKTNKDYSVSTPHPYTAPGLPVTFNTQVNSLYDDHFLTIAINGNQVYNGSYAAYTSQRLNFSGDAAWLTSPATTINYSSAASTSATDLNSVAWIDFKYPGVFDFNNQNSILFSLPANTNDQYFEAGNFDEAGTTPVLYDFTHLLRLQAVVQNDSEKFLLPPSPNAERQLLLIANTTPAIRMVDSLWSVHFVDYSLPQNQGNFLIISHPSLMSDSLGNNYVEDYRDWKNSVGYTAIVANINDLYDQFAYGIRFHPASINKFAEYAINKWAPDEKRYMFLIGKGIEYGIMNDFTWQRPYCLVPTFGFPGSDELLTAFGHSPKPFIPVGRIPCQTPDEVRIYLEKAQLFVNAQSSGFQTIANKAWMKNVLHLAGGANSNDQTYFLNFLNKYKATIEDTLFGGSVYTFSKTSTEPIQQATSDFLDSIIAAGTSLITFFGHSAANSFDFNLDKPENYNNTGKYPLVLTNGCLIGNLFTFYHSLADDFVLTEDHGAIGFLGPSVFSVATSLDLYTDNFYHNLSVEFYDQPVGDVVAASIEDVVTQSGADLDRANAEQMLLAGDPSLKIYTHPKPDYALETQNVSFDPVTVTAAMDSFYLQVIVFNIGKAIDDSIYLDIRRTLPDGTEQYLYHTKIVAPYFIDTFRFSIQTEDLDAFGLNKFYIKVDAGATLSASGDIAEISETNNELSSVNLFINADDILPVFPYDYSIVSAQGVTLKASTVNAFADPKQYVIQIDTTQLFNSPLLQTKKIMQGGGVVKWTPTLTMHDSTVYYWRTSVDTLYGNSFSWHYSSFIYLPGSSPGWNQSHYFQFLSTINEPLGNVTLPDTRVFRYVDDLKSLSVYNGITTWIGGPLSLDDPSYYLNGVRMGRWDCANLGTTSLMAVVDSLTGSLWQNIQIAPNTGYYNSLHCKPGSVRYTFFYNTYSPHNDNVIKFLDTIPDGNYILFMSMNDAYIYGWDSSMKEAFTDLGLSKLNTITSPVPYVFFLKKNDPDYPIYEIVGDTFTSIIDTSFIFSGEWNNGYIESPLIGPAASWTSLHWKTHQIEAGFDSIWLQLIGIKPDGSEVILTNNVLAADTSLSAISVNEYPYLRLRLNSVDTTYHTPVQLDYWRINYQPIPEAALNPALHFSLTDTVNQLVPLHLSCAVENLTPWNMDSMLMKYVITDALNGQHTFTRRYAPLIGNDTIHITYDFDTECDCFSGLNFLFVEANPDEDQPEQHHFNNIGIIDFNVISDDLNPILDVTFDGIHIMDGDIVSAKPEIEIMLKDENQFIPMDDTSSFDIYFIYPDGSKHTIVFDNVTSFFYPADPVNLSKDNTARALLKGQFPVDGEYELVVQGYDRGGNASGDNAYRISFEVINKPMISNVLNYPNPFSTSTRFVFTITGYEIPQQMKITIYTVSGKVVREIFLGEIGNLHIGNNITDFAWDGTDQFGDKLANGLYFYKVTAMLNGKDMDHYENGTDTYFKKGIGKMYLVR